MPLLIIAHRGASAHAPENTLAAFKKALEMHAKAIELDVHLSRDGKLVVIHDEDLKRTSSLNKRVRELTAARLAKENVPILEEVFDLVGDRAELHVEIKQGSSLYPGIEAAVFKLIKKRKAGKRVLISSFDHEALRQVRALDKTARIGYLLGRTPLEAAFREMKEISAESLNLSISQATKSAVAQAHRRGFRVLVYTVNKKSELERLRDCGVDGIFSNFPEIAS
jgi:glycerophosphoryl diester phosphodiesterase